MLKTEAPLRLSFGWIGSLVYPQQDTGLEIYNLTNYSFSGSKIIAHSGKHLQRKLLSFIGVVDYIAYLISY